MGDDHVPLADQYPAAGHQLHPLDKGKVVQACPGVLFASQKAMNIEGLSEATLEKFIGKGWLHTYMDSAGVWSHSSGYRRTGS